MTEETADTADQINDYTADVEQLFIQFFLSDPELFIRCRNIVKSEHFEHNNYGTAINFIRDHVDGYGAMPTLDQIKVATNHSFVLTTGLQDEHKEWFLDNYERFARHKEIVSVVLSSPELIEAKDYGKLEGLIKEAVQIGLVKDLGTDYFEDPLARLDRMMEKQALVPTGFRDIDEKLYGGVEEGSLNLYCGQSGAGKSLFLQNQAINHAEQGRNVVYITLELSEDLCALRLDAMISLKTTRNVASDRKDAALRIKTFAQSHKGSIQIKKFPSGTTAAEIRSYLKEYQIQTGLKVQTICVDYLDLCAPYRTKVNASDVFTKDKYVSEELRDLAGEFKSPLFSASQLNRDSHETADFGHQHIAGGVSKINTADNVFGIYITNAMKEGGRYQIQFLKTRSSSGVGQRVDLKYDPACMKISNMEEGDVGSMETQTDSILTKLSRNTPGMKEKAEPKPQNSADVMATFNRLKLNVSKNN